MERQVKDELEAVLVRWEGAVSTCERDGDTSDAAVKEMEESRAALLVVLRRAMKVRSMLEEIGNDLGAPTTQYFPEQERKELVRRIQKVSGQVQEALRV